jgi:hypothetical protein
MYNSGRGVELLIENLLPGSTAPVERIKN